MINDENTIDDSKSFSSKDSSIDDDLTNEAESSFTEIIVCSLCSRKFSNLSQRKNHFKRMHSSAHKCESCNLTFNTYIELRRHKSVNHPTLRKCFLCNYSHRLKYQVMRHERQAHGENSVACSFEGCLLLLPFCQLKRHIQEVHKKTEINLTEIKKESKINKSLAVGTFNAHKFFVDEIKSNPKNFKQMKSVDIDSKFKCETCGIERNSRLNLRRHVARVHEKRYKVKKKEKKYACTEQGCEKAFISLSLLEGHINIHRGISPYECPRCNKEYAARSSYARHLKKYHSISIKTLQQPLANFSILSNEMK